MGKSFATIVFFSKRPEKAGSTLDKIIQEVAAAGINLEISLIPLETSLGGIIPTAFDRILAQRLGEKALATLQKNIFERNYDFHMVGLHHKEIIDTPFDNHEERHKGTCSKSLNAEFNQHITLMAEPKTACIGLGGDIVWTDTSREENWHGLWTCKKCNHEQAVNFNQKKPLCIFCETPSCHNYGYIRSSRRL